MELELTVNQVTFANVIAEIYQNQETQLYGLRINLGKLAFRTPATHTDIESLKEILGK